jgi:hypothetical protein
MFFSLSREVKDLRLSEKFENGSLMDELARNVAKLVQISSNLFTDATEE